MTQRQKTVTLGIVCSLLGASVSFLALATFYWNLATGWKERDDKLRDMQNQIYVLQRIAVQEHPVYSPMIYPPN